MQPAGAFIDLIGLPSFVLNETEDGVLVFANCNRMWCDLIGHQKSDLIGRPLRDLPETGFDPNWDDSILKDLPHGAQVETPLRLPDGTITLVVTVDRSGVGSPARYLAMHEAPPQLHPTQMAAQSLADDMEQFISFAAHDLRTPMRNIESLAEMLREDFVDMGDGKLELIDMLEQVAVKATQLISDILAQAQSTTPAEQHKPFDLKDLCENIMTVLDPAGKHALSVASTQLIADRTAVQIALRNLLDNALKHNDTTSVALRVEVVDASPGMLRFNVSDDGNGFDDPSIAFLEGGKLRMDSGFGLLGLRRLINARGGTISAENLADGAGCIVQFSLPGRMSRAVEVAST